MFICLNARNITLQKGKIFKEKCSYVREHFSQKAKALQLGLCAHSLWVFYNARWDGTYKSSLRLTDQIFSGVFYVKKTIPLHRSTTQIMEHIHYAFVTLLCAMQRSVVYEISYYILPCSHLPLSCFVLPSTKAHEKRSLWILKSFSRTILPHFDAMGCFFPLYLVAFVAAGKKKTFSVPFLPLTNH